jgi:hypothetical protein
VIVHDYAQSISTLSLTDRQAEGLTNVVADPTCVSGSGGASLTLIGTGSLLGFAVVKKESRDSKSRWEIVGSARPELRAALSPA